jgi:hypothetical protein
VKLIDDTISTMKILLTLACLILVLGSCTQDEPTPDKSAQQTLNIDFLTGNQKINSPLSMLQFTPPVSSDYPGDEFTGTLSLDSSNGFRSFILSLSVTMDWFSHWFKHLNAVSILTGKSFPDQASPGRIPRMPVGLMLLFLLLLKSGTRTARITA